MSHSENTGYEGARPTRRQLLQNRMCPFLEVTGYILRGPLFFFILIENISFAAKVYAGGKKRGLPSEAPRRLKPENSRTSTQYEKSKLNNGFARAPSHVTLNQSKGKFTKIKAVKGIFIWKALINWAKASWSNPICEDEPLASVTRAFISTGS